VPLPPPLQLAPVVGIHVSAVFENWGLFFGDDQSRLHMLETLTSAIASANGSDYFSLRSNTNEASSNGAYGGRDNRRSLNHFPKRLNRM
jgi:hypothetical protein